MISLNNLSEVNYWAVVVVALITFFLGGIWYSPAAFEGAWMTANSYTEQQVAGIQAALGFVGFATTFAAYLVMSLVLGTITILIGANGIGEGLLLGFVLWLGFVAPTGLAVNLFSTRPIASWTIDAGFQLVALLIAAVIFAVWRLSCIR